MVTNGHNYTARLNELNAHLNELNGWPTTEWGLSSGASLAADTSGTYISGPMHQHTIDPLWSQQLIQPVQAPEYYTTTTAVGLDNKAIMKEALKEALKELLAEDTSFNGWLVRRHGVR